MTEDMAIAPELDVNSINEEVSGKIKEDNSGKELASLKMHSGWMQLEEYLNQRLLELRDFPLEGLSVEEMGYKYAISRGIRQELEYILSIVDTNYELQAKKKARGTKE